MKAGDIKDILYYYFIQRKTLSLPGIGTFDMYPISAQTDFANRKILPPGFAISYNHHTDNPDRTLFDYISRKRNIPEWEAIKEVNEFSAGMREKILQGEDFSWAGIGSLKQGKGREILFEPVRLNYPFVSQVEANRVLRESHAHAVLVGDRERTSEEMSELLGQQETFFRVGIGWWPAAAVIAAIALLIIAIRAFTGGVDPNSGRQQLLKPIDPPATHSLISQTDTLK